MSLKTVKHLFAGLAAVCCSLAHGADTNTIPSLTIAGETYRNVDIGSVSGSQVSIFYDGGGRKVAISNLPPELQERLHYNPDLARTQDAAAAQRQAVIRQRAAQDAEAIAAAKAKLGPSQRIHLIKVISDTQLQIVLENGLRAVAYVHNLPPEIIAFVRDLNRTQAAVDAQRFANAGETYNRTVGTGRHAFSVSTGVQTDVAASVTQNRIHLQELVDRDRHGVSSFLARPTAYMLSSTIRQWEFQGSFAP